MIEDISNMLFLLLGVVVYFGVCFFGMIRFFMHLDEREARRSGREM